MDITLTSKDYHLLLQNSREFRQRIIDSFLIDPNLQYKEWVRKNCIGLTKINAIKALRSSHQELMLVRCKDIVEEALAWDDLSRTGQLPL